MPSLQDMRERAKEAGLMKLSFANAMNGFIQAVSTTSCAN